MNYAINNYRFKKIKDKYFITTDHGSYTILDEEEFKKLKQKKIEGTLKDKLEKTEILLDEDTMHETVRLTRNRYNYLFSGTSLHIIVVTLRCDMNCVYCHSSSKNQGKKEFDMDQETAKKTVDFIFESPSENITIEFQGGEPLLNWDIVKYIIEYAEEKNQKAKKDLKITIVTNLNNMDETKLDYLISHKIDICTSLDGPKELHDKNRILIGSSSYEKTVKWIKRLNEEYKNRNITDRKVNALLTLTKTSLKHPKEIIDEYIRLNLPMIHIRFLDNLGVAKTAWPEISYSVEEYLDFWKKANSYIEELKKQGKKINERMVSIMSSKISNELDPNYVDLRSPCGAVIGQLTYNYNGDIYSCDEARMIEDDIFILGNVKKDSYKEIVTSDKSCSIINSSINDQYICDNCVYKPYCGICPVCNYAEQGSIIGKISQTDRCKIYKQQFDWVVKEKFINKNPLN